MSEGGWLKSRLSAWVDRRLGDDGNARMQALTTRENEFGFDAFGFNKQDAKVAALCAQQVPGDTYRNLEVHTAYTRQTFKHILAPVWLLSYKFGRKAYQCVINGVTGAIEGEYPKSPWKIALLVLAALIVLGIFVSFSGGR